MITLNQITKYYNKKKALQNFNFNINKGEIHALIGPNGSGKTTAVGVILSLLHFKGEAKINFQKSKIGVSLENNIFFERLSVFENLKFSANLKNIHISEVDKAIDNLRLNDLAFVKIKKLSKGNRRKVSIASSLIGNPDFYIFDEPLSGLDFDNVILFRELISKLKKENKTVMINSHILSEIEKICTNFTFIFNGKNIGDYNSDEIITKYKTLEKAYSENIPLHNIKFK